MGQPKQTILLFIALIISLFAEICGGLKRFFISIADKITDIAIK